MNKPHRIVLEGVRQLLEVTKRHKAVYQFIVDARAAITASEVVDDADLVDVRFCLRQLAELADDTRKECEGLGALVAKVACVLWTNHNAARPGAPKNMQGRLATGVPRLGVGANVPRRLTEDGRSLNPEYVKLMRVLGVPDQFIGQDIVKIHWPHFCEWLLARTSEGLPLPPGVNPEASYPTFGLEVRTKGVDLDQFMAEAI